MSDGGKGSSSRPLSVNHAQFSNNWDLIFGKKKSKEHVATSTENSYNNANKNTKTLPLTNQNPPKD
jgi:hypothetical protein